MPTTGNPKPKRRLLQFNLRGMLLLLVVIAASLSWTMHKARQQRNAVAELRTYGYWVNYRRADSGSATFLEWLRRLLGEKEFRDVIGAGSSHPLCNDNGLAQISELPRIRTLSLGNSQVTDAGLAYLEGLTQLNDLYLDRTQITDAGLPRLQNFTQLRHLNLGGTHVTDSALAHLEGFGQLTGLNLSGTQITDAGLVHLRRLNQLQTLALMDTKVTDAGLVHLQGLNHLQYLDLRLTMSLPFEAGRKELMKALPNLKVRDD